MELSSIEIIVVAAAAEILDRRNVQISDDFFALGADSLDAVEFATRLSIALGFEIESSDIVTALTLADLASAISVKRGD